ncbi:MAG: TraB/GumN family protein [Bacteroidota bacterium]
MKKTLLWRITPLSGGPDSYLFGTMHVRDLRAFRWYEIVLTYLNQCTVFATEFNFSELDGRALAETLHLPEGQTLDKMLRPGVWKGLERIAQQRLGFSAALLKYQHPMAVNTLISSSLLAEEAAQSLDETLWSYAQAAGKLMIGVESFEDQLNTIRSIDLEHQVAGLTWLVKNFVHQKKRLHKLMRWYEAGDLQQLYKAAKKDAKGMRRVMLYDRNYNMAVKFVEVAKTQSLFCAVGAGHLPGEKGMLRLLKKAGFKVKPVSADITTGAHLIQATN